MLRQATEARKVGKAAEAFNAMQGEATEPAVGRWRVAGAWTQQRSVADRATRHDVNNSDGRLFQSREKKRTTVYKRQAVRTAVVAGTLLIYPRD